MDDEDRTGQRQDEDRMKTKTRTKIKPRQPMAFVASTCSKKARQEQGKGNTKIKQDRKTKTSYEKKNDKRRTIQ
jgi:hypothetical protein